MICPSCKGEGRIVFFSHDRNVIYMPCPDCIKTGKVDDHHLQWKVIGQKLQEARLLRMETLRNFCKRTGANSALRSRQERGFSDPTGIEP